MTVSSALTFCTRFYHPFPAIKSIWDKLLPAFFAGLYTEPIQQLRILSNMPQYFYFLTTLWLPLAEETEFSTKYSQKMRGICLQLCDEISIPETQEQRHSPTSPNVLHRFNTTWPISREVSAIPYISNCKVCPVPPPFKKRKNRHLTITIFKIPSNTHSFNISS